MNRQDMLEKIYKVKRRIGHHEIFNKLRPPEEFGDAVELCFQQKEQTFKAIVFDPETKLVFYNKELPDEQTTLTFITNVLNGQTMDSETQGKDEKQPEYINIYWDEWH